MSGGGAEVCGDPVGACLVCKGSRPCWGKYDKKMELDMQYNILP